MTVADIPQPVRDVPSRPGTYRRPCPHCRKGRKDDALAVTVDRDGGAVWYCHRCGDAGGTRDGRTVHHEGDPDRGRPDTGGTADHDRGDDAERKRRSARRLIQDSAPARGTLVATYLAHRGMELPGDAPLFFHPRAFHWPSGTRQPAMVAPIQSIETNRLQGAHLTFLRPEGKGKAELDKPRLYLGPKAGGAVKITPDPEVEFGLCIAEGIETALTAWMAGYPAWAVLDSGNLRSFPTLSGIDHLTAVADHDEAGISAARAAVARWRQAGHEAREIIPPQPGTDLNDRITAMEAA